MSPFAKATLPLPPRCSSHPIVRTGAAEHVAARMSPFGKATTPLLMQYNQWLFIVRRMAENCACCITWRIYMRQSPCSGFAGPVVCYLCIHSSLSCESTDVWLLRKWLLSGASLLTQQSDTPRGSTVTFRRQHQTDGPSSRSLTDLSVGKNSLQNSKLHFVIWDILGFVCVSDLGGNY